MILLKHLHFSHFYKGKYSKKNTEKAILEKTNKFHHIMEERKKNTELKIAQMKVNALKDIKNIS